MFKGKEDINKNRLNVISNAHYSRSKIRNVNNRFCNNSGDYSKQQYCIFGSGLQTVYTLTFMVLMGLLITKIL